MSLVPSDPKGDSDPEPSLAVNTALSWLTFAGRAGFAFVATLVVARVLGPTGRGEVTYVINIAALAALFLSAGTAVALVEMRVNSRWSDNRLHNAALAASVVVGLLFAAVAVGASLFVEGSARTTLLVAAVVSVPLVAMANLNQTAGLADRLRLVAWTALVGFGLYALFTVVTAVLGTMTVRNNLAFWVVSSILPVSLMLWPGRIISARSPDLGRDTRALLKSSIRMNISAVAVLAIWRADIVLVEFRRGFEELGLYSIAVGCAEIVVALSVGVRAAVLPNQAGANHVRTADVLCAVTRVSIPIVSFLALLVAAVGPSGIERVFGEEYRSSYPALVLLLPGVVLLVLHYPLFDFVMARGGNRSLTVMGVVGISLNVSLNLILLTRFSFAAASVVSSLCYLLIFGWCVAEFTRRSGRSASEVLIVRRSDVAAIKRRVVNGRGRVVAE